MTWHKKRPQLDALVIKQHSAIDHRELFIQSLLDCIIKVSFRAQNPWKKHWKIRCQCYTKPLGGLGRREIVQSPLVHVFFSVFLKSMTSLSGSSFTSCTQSAQSLLIEAAAVTAESWYSSVGEWLFSILATQTRTRSVVLKFLKKKYLATFQTW